MSMRGYVRFTIPADADCAIYWGFLENNKIEILSGEINQFQFTGRFYSPDKVKLLAPVIPSKIVGVGRNYVAHIAELGNKVPQDPLIFYKPTSSIIGQGEDIIYPSWSDNLHFEGELAVVIGKAGYAISVEQSQDYIFGYTIAIDLTARDRQSTDGQWWRAKGADTFCPLGPVIVPEHEFDPSANTIITTVCGVEKQHGSISQMIIPIPQIIAHISSAITLLPGDVILTGTPAGVGSLQRGDIVTVRITGIGELSNPVR